MATNLALDDGLIKEARQLGGQRTKKDVVTQALVEYIQRRKQLKLRDLFGTVDFEDEKVFSQRDAGDKVSDRIDSPQGINQQLGSFVGHI